MKRKEKDLDQFSNVPAVSSPVFWYFVRKMIPWLVAVAGYIVIATMIVRWDMARHGEPLPEFGVDLYGIYMQLFFEPTEPLPHALIARIVFWVTPILGVGLVARGLLRVGASVFDVEERRRLWAKIMTDRMKDHIIVCGLGHVGIRVIEALRKLEGDVVAIERTEADSFATSAEKLGVPVLYGDARRDDLLIEAGVRQARAVVCATDDDLTNLEVAIDARRENPKIRVIMRVYDQRVAGKIGSALDLDETFSPAALAGPLVALQALEKGVRAVYRLANGDLRVDMEVHAPAGWWGKKVATCEDMIDGRIVAISRKGGPMNRARHGDEIEKGDVLSLDVPASNVSRVRAAN